MKTLAFMATVAMAAMLAACGGTKCENGKCEAIPLETSTAALDASDNVKQNLIDLGDMLAFLESSDLVLNAFNMLEDPQMVCTPVPAGEDGEPECHEKPPQVEVDTDLTEVAKEIAEWLNEYVFVDGQLESEGDSLVYLLNPATFCAMDGEESEECAETLTKIPLRVRLTSYNEGDLDIDILVGDAQLDPIDIRLYSNLLGIAVDLAATRAVAQLYLDTFGEAGENPELPTTFSGVVSLSLERVSADEFKLTSAVEQAIQVGMTVEGDEFDFSLGKSTISMTANQADETIALAADIGALGVVIPYQLFINAMWDEGDDEFGEGFSDDLDDIPEPQPYDDIMEDEVPVVAGTASLQIAGFSGSASFAADSDSLTFTGLGLGNGPTTFKHNGDTLLSIDLNQGGTFDLDISVDGEDVVLEVVPEFDLSVMMALTKIAGDLNELPAFMADDTLSVTLDGNAAPALRVLDEADGIQVAAGQLTLASVAYPEDTVIVAAGQCLFADDDSPQVPDGGSDEDPLPESGEDGHELLTSLSIGECQ